jgi:hypothetical protein
MLNRDKSATLDVTDSKATRPVKKQGTLKMILRQLQSAGSPPLVGEEVLPPKRIGAGNYHWYPLAWTRWLVRWDRFKTLILLVVLLALVCVELVIRKRHSYEVNLPVPSTELLLKSRGFDTFNQSQAEAFILFVVNAANQSSSEGMQNLNLLEGSMEPSIYLRLQQKGFNQKLNNIPLTEYPIYTIYIAEVTRWRYNAATRIVSAYAKGFRMSNTISGKGGMEKYRALIEIFWEPMSNRNKWGYYVQKLDEFYGTAADAHDTELQSRDRSGF